MTTLSGAAGDHDAVYRGSVHARAADAVAENMLKASAKADEAHSAKVSTRFVISDLIETVSLHG